MNHLDCPQLHKTLPHGTLRRAFTLIELLIVIALTALLLTLLIVPLISALRYTQQAQIVTAAQDAARITKERITRELGSAVFVFDGTSHPFQLASGTLTPGDDAYTNFLDLQILDKNGSSVVAHAYNAKLDFVLPKLNDSGAAIDPTTNEPITYTQSSNGSAVIGSPSYVFPLAAGTNAVRYFVGLKDPTKPYNNTREGKANGSTDNTYILYRAEYQPYKPVTDANGKVIGVAPNADLFATRKNSSGTPIPELDDPDFFRYVNQNGTTDTNWLDDNKMHAAYPAQDKPGTVGAAGSADGPGTAPQHNNRVDKWIQIAKPVIPGPNVDLILLPHNADNTLNYDAGNPLLPPAAPCTATACPAIAHSGIATDPVTGKAYPIVNTSVTFRPATISGNATPGTTSDYNTQGAVSVDQSGYTYTPTVYTAGSQSWSLPFHVSLYPGNYDATNAALSMYYDTEQFASGQARVTAPSAYTVPQPNPPLTLNPGDILEYLHQSTDTDAVGTLVYNVTQGYPVSASGAGYVLGEDPAKPMQFVPMTINPDSGTLTFAAPSLPNGPYDRLTRQWPYILVDPTIGVGSQAYLDAQNKGIIAADGTVDLTTPASATPALTDSPLQGYHQFTVGGNFVSTGVLNAHIVPGSVRVTGPDQTSGPNAGQAITYTEVNASVGTVSDNQFSIDYGTGVLHLLPGTTGVGVVYDYQANLSLTTPLPMPLPSTQTLPINLAADPYLPMQVKVDYQTRDLIDVNIGVRIFDITNNRAQVIPTETKIKIGNSNR